MYSEVFTIITDRMAAIGLANVDTALGDEPPLPAVQVYLAKDNEVKTQTIVIRELLWGVKVTVGHNNTDGAAQAEMLTILDTIRDGFAGWLPTSCVGIQDGFRVQVVAVEDYKDHGSTVYTAVLAVRVVPDTFKVV